MLKNTAVDYAWTPDTYCSNTRQSNLMIGGSDGDSAMTINLNGHLFLSKRFVWKFDFIEHVDKCAITTLKRRKRDLSRVGFFSNVLLNVQLYDRKRFGELKFRALGPHQRERVSLLDSFLELFICGLGFLCCFRDHYLLSERAGDILKK